MHFSMTLELNFCLDKAGMCLRNKMQRGSMNWASPRSTACYQLTGNFIYRWELTNVLNHVVSIRILNKDVGIVSDLLDQLRLLGDRGVVDASLQHTAPMTMSSDSHTIGADGIVDELLMSVKC